MARFSFDVHLDLKVSALSETQQVTGRELIKAATISYLSYGRTTIKILVATDKLIIIFMLKPKTNNGHFLNCSFKWALDDSKKVYKYYYYFQSLILADNHYGTDAHCC